MIIGYNSKEYTPNKQNGAYWYSYELVNNIIPHIKTDRPWVTVMVKGVCYDRAIFFIHNNLRPERYEWLEDYKELILVCGIPETVEKVQHLGTPIFLPLSIDTEYVKGFRAKKTRDTAFAGRPAKKNLGSLPAGIDYLEGMSRFELLEKMARYKNIYAVGRTALEAKCLRCKILPYDNRFPDVKRWKVLDNKDVIPLLQAEIDRIDGGNNEG